MTFIIKDAYERHNHPQRSLAALAFCRRDDISFTRLQDLIGLTRAT